MPTYTLILPFEIECVDVMVSGQIRVVVISADTSRPVVAAVVAMPISETSMLVD